MKKVSGLSISIFSAIIITCLVSCSNSQETKLVYTESNTIKQNVKDKEQEITWTIELEGDRLTQTVNRNSMEIGAEVPYNTELFKLTNSKKAAVYPSIEEFGSLDVSNLRKDVKGKVTQFCEAFNSENHGGAESFFSRKYIFNYVFFIKDLEEGFEKNFGKKLPEKDEVINKWLLGEPFNGNDIIQIPVRFYTDYGTIDMTMFLNSNGNNELYQITIDRWKKV